MISLTVAQQASISGSLVTICRTWDIILRDGATLRLTDHDRPLVVGLKTYYPANSLAASALVRGGGTKERDREIKAALDVDLVTEEELLAGRFRDAMVKEAVVDWMNVGNGQFLQEIYWIKSTTSNGQYWTANIDSAMSFARLPSGRNYTRDCIHILGDSKCTVNIGPLTVTGEVASLVTDSYSGVFTTDVTTEPHTNFYYNGKLTFTSGQNSGLSYVVKTCETASAGKITLWLEPVFPVTVGDTFDLIPGCDKKFSTCKDTFSNAVNHGGFPFLIGQDRLFATPDAKE